jgi:hypothetical protein
VSGSAIGFEGQCTVFIGGCEQLCTDTRYAALEKLPCYRCLHPRPSQASLCQSCSGSGVFGPAPGIIGTMLAGEAIKCLLLHLGTDTDAGMDAGADTGAVPRGMEVLVGKQAYYDGLTGQTVTFNLPPRRADCPLCSTDPTQRTILSMQDSEKYLTSLGGSADMQPGTGAGVGGGVGVDNVGGGGVAVHLCCRLQRECTYASKRACATGCARQQDVSPRESRVRNWAPEWSTWRWDELHRRAQSASLASKATLRKRRGRGRGAAVPFASWHAASVCSLPPWKR